MKIIAVTARILAGIVFIYSGFVKGIDPWGSTYKFIDYFTAFNMMWMQPAAFTLALLQNAVELVIGVTLLLGLRMKETAWGLMLFMGFYTVLTLILALTNPVHDCGCFGDALILTNWETFYKNLVLMALTLIIFFYRKKYLPAYSFVGEWIWVGMIGIASIVVSIHCYQHLPWIDFRPYHIGANITEGMTVPEGKPVDEYRTSLLYEKDGVVKEFDMSDYPWDDSTWIFKDSKTSIIKKGYTPSIHDFSIITREGYEITDEVLSDEGFTFLLVAHRLTKSDRQALKKASNIAGFCKENDHRFYALTASPQNEIEYLKSELGLKYDFCFTDEITLKTIIRANPGLLLLQKGTVVGKWHFNDMPDTGALKSNLLSYALKQQAGKSGDRLINLLFVAFVLFAFVFFHFRSLPTTTDQ